MSAVANQGTIEERPPFEVAWETIDGLKVRYATGGTSGERIVLFSPWPESIFAFAPVWGGLVRQFGVLAIDLPGGPSEVVVVASAEIDPRLVELELAAQGEHGPDAICRVVGTLAEAEAIAQRIGFPKAIRAVAGACAANNLAVVIPCHRVVRNDGALSGYAWGVERKKALLDREGAR